MSEDSIPSIPSISRRRLLGGAALATGSVAVLGACTAQNTTAAPGTTTAAARGAGTTFVAGTIPEQGAAGQLGAGTFQLFSQADLNFQGLFALGSAGQNSEVGETITAVNQANAAPGGASYQSFYDAFIAMGNQVGGWADTTVNRGHTVTARGQLLRAAQYYNQALFFVLGTSTPSAEQQVFETMNAAFTKAASLMQPAWEPVAIPYEGSNLPAWFVKAVGVSGPRPTIILNNGSDGQNVDLWAYGAQAAQERGYNALMLQGPGQGEMLFVRKVPFRPDWEKVITPVVDYLVTRPDVDAKKIALTGWSFGGLLVARAAAFEKRLAAVVSDPGLLSSWPAFPEDLRKVADAGDEAAVNKIWNDVVLQGATPEQQFSLRKRLEIFSTQALEEVRQGKAPSNWYQLAKTIKQYDVTPVVKQITAPYLVTNYELENFYAGGAQQLYDALTTKKDLVTFTVAEGAQYHDAPMAPQRRNEVIFDWLDETLAS